MPVLDEQKGVWINYESTPINRIDRENEYIVRSVIPLMYRIVSEYKSNEKNTRSEFNFMVLTFYQENPWINILGNYEISCYPHTKTIDLGKLDCANGRTNKPCAINLVVGIDYITPNENLLKHNTIFNLLRNEDIRTFNFGFRAQLHAVYKSNTI